MRLPTQNVDSLRKMCTDNEKIYDKYAVIIFDISADKQKQYNKTNRRINYVYQD